MALVAQLCNCSFVMEVSSGYMLTHHEPGFAVPCFCRGLFRVQRIS